MSRASKVLSFLVLIVLTAGYGFPQPAVDETPELVVSLAPAGGVVPVAEFDQPKVYSFQAWAFYDNRRRFYVKAETFVRPGQTRSVNETTKAGWRVQGTVALTDSGMARYNADLFREGKRILSSSADLVLEKR